MKLKKILLILSFVFCSTISFASWFDKVADTVSTVDSIVNNKPAEKVTISELINSDTKYINKAVEVKGKVLGLAVDTEGKFVIIIEDGNNKLKLYMNTNPTCRLLDNIKVIGIYNGYGITQTKLRY